MPNANKNKGTRWESAVRDLLNFDGNDAYRIAQAGEDQGDILLNGLFSLQCKDVAASNYSKWVKDTQEQARAAGVPFGVVVHKRRQRPANDGYVVMDLDTFSSIAMRLKVTDALRRDAEKRNSDYTIDILGRPE